MQTFFERPPYRYVSRRRERERERERATCTIIHNLSRVFLHYKLYYRFPNMYTIHYMYMYNVLIKIHALHVHNVMLLHELMKDFLY